MSHCTLGVGCEEAGICYAAAHNVPEKCGRPDYAELKRLREENDKLRGIIAWSALDCIYCGLSLGDQGKCASDFPGCARADDQMCSTPLQGEKE